MSELVCWKCGASIAHLSLPLRRQDECDQCAAALHACKLCEFYDISVARHCREPIAEVVIDKERANFCDYFKPREGAYSNKNLQDAAAAREKLDSLFGGGAPSTPNTADEARSKLEELFKKK